MGAGRVSGAEQQICQHPMVGTGQLGCNVPIHSALTDKITNRRVKQEVMDFLRDTSNLLPRNIELAFQPNFCIQQLISCPISAQFELP